MNYDIIGDIHGEVAKLTELLFRLGYRVNARAGGAWTHPERQAVFVGDLCDRGAGQLETLEIVRRMVDAGAARAHMGNHELNAIAFYLKDPARPGHHLRARRGSAGEKNRAQHQAFLDAVVEDSPLHREWVEWFLTLPLFGELPGGDGRPGIRVAHACWDQRAVDELKVWLAPGNRLTENRMAWACMKGNWVNQAVDLIAKGPEVRLPAGHFYLDKEGSKRTKTRIRWWAPEAKTWRKIAVLKPEDAQRLPDTEATGFRRPVNDGKVPTFFGHYWLTGAPRLMAPTMACLDYSVAKGGELVAYRWDGEPVLDPFKFVSTRPASDNLPKPRRL